MPTITVKNIPDGLYERLKTAAEGNRRSINSEIIKRIERSLTSQRVPTDSVLKRLRRFHDSFGDTTISIEDIDAARREGRP